MFELLVVSSSIYIYFEGFPANVPTQAGGGIKILGAGIGSPDVIRSYASARVAKIAAIIERLPTLDDVQLQYLFLKYCAGMPRMNFQLRVCHPDILDTVITEFDELMYDGIHALFGNR